MAELTDGHDLIAPEPYGANGQPHETYTRLRQESPVHRCEPAGFPPFWAITRHADICRISKAPDLFLSAPGIMLLSHEERAARGANRFGGMRSIIEMDPPEHRAFRKVASSWFTPRALARVDEAVARSAREIVDRLAGDTGEGECDFATEVATVHPLRILSTILGVSREHEPDILRLSNQLFAPDDPDMQRKADDRKSAHEELGLEFYQLFEKIIADRRAKPRDDLATVLATAVVDGEPMGPVETFGYYLSFFVAGHDTTKNSIAGGIRALVEHPAQLEKLQREPDLVPIAVEEIVRWTSPVNYMKRTVATDVEFRGEKLKAGDELALFYASANRDESIFEDPFEFRVDRSPNRHLGFGIGEHFCLGAHLARRSQQSLFRELVTRLEHAELAGEPEHIQTSFVVGLKRLPIRYRIRKSR